MQSAESLKEVRQLNKLLAALEAASAGRQSAARALLHRGTQTSGLAPLQQQQQAANDCCIGPAHATAPPSVSPSQHQQAKVEMRMLSVSMCCSALLGAGDVDMLHR